MRTYTYTIFDADPAVSGPSAWPHQEGIRFEAENDKQAVETARQALETACQALDSADGYDPGDQIHMLVWDADYVQIATLVEELGALDEGDHVVPPVVGGKGETKMNWEFNAMTGNSIGWVSDNCRIVRLRGMPYLYVAEYWGDYSLDYPKRGPVRKTLGQAKEDLKRMERK